MTERSPSQEFSRRSANSKRAWADPEVRQRIIDGIKKGLAPSTVRRRMSKTMKKVWRDSVVRQRMIDAMNRPEVSQAKSKANKDRWSNPELARQLSEAIKRGQADPRVRRRMSKGIKAAWTPERLEQKSQEVTSVWAERKRKMADAEANVQAAEAKLAEAKAEVERLRNQQRVERRDPLITLAICLKIQGVKKGAMWAELYPGHLKKAAVDKTKKLFKRRWKDMEAENSRISALSESQRQAEADWARPQISQPAHRPPAAA